MCLTLFYVIFCVEDYLKYGSYVIWFNMKRHDEERGAGVPRVI
jgi:hypothetical protein